MGIFYRLFRSITLSILPLVVVFYSLVWTIDNPESYSTAFKINDFYNQIVVLIKQNPDLENTSNNNINIIFGLLLPVTEKFTPAQWQALVEENIITFTDWLSGKSENLMFFVPTEDIESILSKNLDQIVEENTSKLAVPVCTDSQIQEVQKQGGFDTDQYFCVPEDVLSGEKTLTDYFNIQHNEILDKLFTNNYLSLQRNRYTLEDLKMPLSVESFISGPLNLIRNFTLEAKNLTLNVTIFSVSLFGLCLILAWLARKDLGHEIAYFFKSMFFGLISLIFFLLLSLGGTYYLNASILGIFLPIFRLGESVNLILRITLNIGFNLLQPALWVSLACLILWIVFTIFAKKKKKLLQVKNDQIVGYQPDHKHTQTFDSQFKEELKRQTIAPQDFAKFSNESSPKYYTSLTTDEESNLFTDYAQEEQGIFNPTDMGDKTANKNPVKISNQNPSIIKDDKTDTLRSRRIQL